MNDYLITMDTGDKVISHYGVKGQKWGVRNHDTLVRYGLVEGGASGGGGITDEPEDPGITEDELKRKLKNGEITTEEYNRTLTKIGEYEQTKAGAAKKRVNDAVKKSLNLEEDKTVIDTPTNEEYIRDIQIEQKKEKNKKANNYKTFRI